MTGKICLFVYLLLFSAAAMVCSAQQNANKGTPSLSYSELFENKANYIGKLVRVNAIHIFGFEWSFLCDKECEKRKTDTWVEFVDEDELCKGSKSKIKKGSDKHFDNRAEVVYLGRLSEGSFGHFGVYNYQFTVTCVEKFKKLPPLN